MIQEQTKVGHSLKVEIEKLDGGFISNITGKRRIYKNAVEIDESVDLKDILSKVEENEYILSIDLVPKDTYKDPVIEEEIITERSALSLLEQAKLDGIIQPAEKFDPLKHEPKIDDSKPIAITEASSYSIAQLSAIDWVEYDRLFPLTTSEKSEISGIVGSTMYNVWNKIVAGKFQWQSVGTKVGMTILAKYYERKLEKRNKAEGVPPRNDKRLMEIITEIELLAKSQHVKSNVLLKKTDQLKKLLIQN